MTKGEITWKHDSILPTSSSAGGPSRIRGRSENAHGFATVLDRAGVGEDPRSQINGYAVCTDMHTKDALALTEQATRIADSVGVDDDTWETARKHFGDAMAALIVVIAVINAFDRFNVIVRAPAGGLSARPVRVGSERAPKTRRPRRLGS